MTRHGTRRKESIPERPRTRGAVMQPADGAAWTESARIARGLNVRD